LTSKENVIFDTASATKLAQNLIENEVLRQQLKTLREQTDELITLGEKLREDSKAGPGKIFREISNHIKEATEAAAKNVLLSEIRNDTSFDRERDFALSAACLCLNGCPE